MKMSRGGVVYNLADSPYIYQGSTGLNLYFSSMYHLKKFEEQQAQNRKECMESLYRRFKVYVLASELYDLTLYRKIETRGFYVTCKGEEFEWPQEIILSGVRQIRKKSQA